MKFVPQPANGIIKPSHLSTAFQIVGVLSFLGGGLMMFSGGQATLYGLIVLAAALLWLAIGASLQWLYDIRNILLAQNLSNVASGGGHNSDEANA